MLVEREDIILSGNKFHDLKNQRLYSFIHTLLFVYFLLLPLMLFRLMLKTDLGFPVNNLKVSIKSPRNFTSSRLQGLYIVLVALIFPHI